MESLDRRCLEQTRQLGRKEVSININRSFSVSQSEFFKKFQHKIFTLLEHLKGNKFLIILKIINYTKWLLNRMNSRQRRNKPYS